jgi:hypothetical protein
MQIENTSVNGSNTALHVSSYETVYQMHLRAEPLSSNSLSKMNSKFKPQLIAVMVTPAFRTIRELRS